MLETADRLLVNARGLFNDAVGGRLCVSYIQLQTLVRALLLLSSSSRWSSLPCFSSPNVLFSVTSPFVARAVTKSKSQVLNFYLKISIVMHYLSSCSSGELHSAAWSLSQRCVCCWWPRSPTVTSSCTESTNAVAAWACTLLSFLHFAHYWWHDNYCTKSWSTRWAGWLFSCWLMVFRFGGSYLAALGRSALVYPRPSSLRFDFYEFKVSSKHRFHRFEVVYSSTWEVQF